MIVLTLFIGYVNFVTAKPNVLFILADDLGWNDVGFHGSDSKTPNIDALAFNSMILHNYYTSPICTPSRSEIFTAKYPIHTGMQVGVLMDDEARGLPIDIKLLPDYLRGKGYDTSLIGKWHLGYYKREYMPTRRGFDKFYGPLGGCVGYYDLIREFQNGWGFDFRNNEYLDIEQVGQFVLDSFKHKVIETILNRNKTKPLFIFYSSTAVHAGTSYANLAGPYSNSQYTELNYKNRTEFANILFQFDRQIGEIVSTLHAENILNDTIIIFASDNGAKSSAHFIDKYVNYGSNYPLRGEKYTLWEGGIRTPAFIWSAYLDKQVNHNLFHSTDWLPTILHMVDTFPYFNNSSNLTLDDLDGINQFKNKREIILHNINSMNYAVRKGDYKLIFSLIDGNKPSFVYQSDSYVIDNTSTLYKLLGVDVEYVNTSFDIMKLRCAKDHYDCEGTCLYNIRTDPCEQLSINNTCIKDELYGYIEEFIKTSIPPSNLPFDPANSPNNYNHTYTNFGDYN